MFQSWWTAFLQGWNKKENEPSSVEKRATIFSEWHYAQHDPEVDQWAVYAICLTGCGNDPDWFDTDDEAINVMARLDRLRTMQQISQGYLYVELRAPKA